MRRNQEPDFLAGSGQDQVLSKAEMALKSNHLAEAEKLARQVLGREQSNLWANLVLAATIVRARKFDDAVPLLQGILRIAPDSFEAAILLAETHRELGQIDEAMRFSYGAIKMRPAEAEGHFQFGLTLLAVHQPDRAVTPLVRAVSLLEGPVFSNHFLSRIYPRMARLQDALMALEEAVTEQQDPKTFLLLAQVLMKTSDFERSAVFSRKAMGLQPNSMEASLTLFDALIAANRKEEAEDLLARTAELSHTAKDSFGLAVRQRSMGLFEDAAKSLWKAIDRDSSFRPAYALLAYTAKVPGRDFVTGMEQLLPDSSPDDQSALHYGLGKALEDLGEFRESMTHYDEANRLARRIKIGNKPFDELGYVEQMDRIIQATPAEGLELGFEHADPSALPVLIFGIMRSGTTLAEQILSCHPQVGAAGELPFWGQTWNSAFNPNQRTLDPARLSALGQDYIRLLSKHWPGMSRVTDKRPGNSHLAGIVHRALPNARMIHIRRRPIDVGLSIWTTPNQSLSDGAHTKRGIVRTVQEQMRLFEHWRTVLPPARFLEVDYEELVQDPERIGRQMVEFCDLEWNEACLHPELSKHAITTPSVWQARQPVYLSSVGRWRKFEPWLGELADLIPLQHRAVSQSKSGGKKGVQSQRIHQSIAKPAEPPKSSSPASRDYESVAAHLKEAGRFDEAIVALERAISLNPKRVGLYLDIVTSRRITANDAQLIEQLESLLLSPPIGTEGAQRLHFALGKAYEDIREYEKAIEHFDRANRLAVTALNAKGQAFDGPDMELNVRSLIERYTLERLQCAPHGSQSSRPVFIVGLVRSGTTLVEQILSRHSAVAAGGELPFWSTAWRTVRLEDSETGRSTNQKIARDYEKGLGQLAGRRQHVTDKMPSNVIALGAIHTAFPNAKIVLCRRHPVDNCLSIYCTPFHTAHRWVHTREDIVFYYRLHERMVTHWKAVLPQNSLIEVQYEQLISETDQTIKRMLDFLGLDWEESCLTPERNARPVKTPSQWQVRQPIYNSSVDRWRNYEPWLGQFRELLEVEREDHA